MRRILCLLLLTITQSASAEPCSVLLREEKATVHDCAGIHLVRLRGSPVERAAKFGELIRRKVLATEVIHYFSDKVSSVVLEKTGTLGGAIMLAYHQLLRLFHRNVPRELTLEVDAFSQAMGVDPIVVRRGLSLPDTAVWIQGLGSLPGLSFIPTVGCTSLSARLPNGGFSYGRNLDFAGVGVWDRHPMLLVAEPDPGSGELRHLVIGADGLLWGGITGVNEAGITFAVHQNFSSDISLSGLPMIYVGELLLRQAKTLEEAVEILRANRPANRWTFVLTDLKKGESLAVESSTRVFFVRRNEGRLFVQTNHGMHEQTRQTENASFGMEANSIFRMKQAITLLDRDAVNAKSLAKALAYQADPDGRLFAYHDILKAETLQTVIFESRPGLRPRLHLSIDPAPTPSGRFASFPLEAFWTAADVDKTEINTFTNITEKARANQRETAEAYRLYFDEQKPLEAAELLKNQRTLNTMLFRSVALLEANFPHESLQEAEAALQEPRFLGEPEHIRLSLERVRLASLIHLKRTAEARSLASGILERKNTEEAASRSLRDLAKKILFQKALPGWMLSPHFDFFSGDLHGRKD